MCYVWKVTTSHANAHGPLNVNDIYLGFIDTWAIRAVCENMEEEDETRWVQGERVTFPTRSMVFQGDFTSKLSTLPLPPTTNLSPGSMTPAISSTDVNVFSSIKAATCIPADKVGYTCAINQQVEKLRILHLKSKLNKHTLKVHPLQILLWVVSSSYKCLCIIRQPSDQGLFCPARVLSLVHKQSILTHEEFWF